MVWAQRLLHGITSLAGLLNKRLTLWGRVTHICVSKLAIIGSDNVLSPGRRQAIIWTNAALLSIGTLETNIFIQENAFKDVVWKMASILNRPQCVKLGHEWVRTQKTMDIITYPCPNLSYDRLVIGILGWHNIPCVLRSINLSCLAQVQRFAPFVIGIFICKQSFY